MDCKLVICIFHKRCLLKKPKFQFDEFKRSKWNEEFVFVTSETLQLERNSLITYKLTMREKYIGLSYVVLWLWTEEWEQIDNSNRCKNFF